MAKVFGLEIKGVDLVLLRLATENKRISEDMKTEMYRQGTKIEAEAKRILESILWTNQSVIRRGPKSNRVTYPIGSSIIGHVDKGTLWKSINTKATIESATKMEVEIGTHLVYARKIEKLPDGGFMYPAYLNKVDDVKKGLQRVVLDAIKRMNGR